MKHLMLLATALLALQTQAKGDVELFSYPLFAGQACESGLATPIYCEAEFDETEELYTTDQKRTNWVGGGRDQDWGCEQIQGRFTKQIADALAQHPEARIVHSQQDEDDRTHNFATEYRYYCEVKVVVDVKVTKRDPSCGVEQYAYILPGSDLSDIEGPLYCLDCSHMEETDVAENIVRCVADRLSVPDTVFFASSDEDKLRERARALRDVGALNSLPFGEARKVLSFIGE